MSLVTSGMADDFDPTFAPEEYEPIYLSTSEDGRELVQRGEIAEVLSDPFVLMAMKEWRRFRRFGLAHGGGYANERRLYIAIIEACETEYDFVSSCLRKKNGE